jgi:cobalt-zinc-cadmium efflux system protein
VSAAHGHGHGHSHGRGHGHGHGHSHGLDRSQLRRSLWACLLLIVLYMIAEVVGGVLSGSLALLADAGHMFSDAAALSLTLFATWIATRPADPQRTYGYYRVEILAALANGAALGALSLWLFYESAVRLVEPTPVRGELMLGVASGGLVVNLVALWLLHRGSAESLNVRGAWLHVLADTLGSVGAMASGVVILAFDWRWADPLAGLLIGTLVVVSAWRLLRDTARVLLEQAPAHLDVEEIRAGLAEVPGVLDVHDLHVWTITSGLEALSGHVVVGPVCHREEMLTVLRDLLHERFGIDHVTLQIEPEGFAEREAIV